jgi:hypothetical protein
MADQPETGILASLTKAIDNLKTVRVVTIVGPLKVTTAVGAEEKFVVGPQDPGAQTTYKAMLSTIDVLEGDIVNAMDKEFVSNDASDAMSKLRTFHEEQVSKAVATLQSNAKGLIDLVKYLTEAKAS